MGSGCAICEHPALRADRTAAFREARWARLEGPQVMKYAVVIEKGPTSYGASVPDLPGCVAVAETREEVERLIQEAVALHVDGLRKDGLPVPDPQTLVTTVDVA